MTLTPLVLGLVLTSVVSAVTLPKERADLLYHRYEGGGMEIDGPSVLVRKNFDEKFSVSGNYYVDNVSSASIDVITSGASEYTEERTEYSADITAINGKSLVNIGYTNSDESDYTANSYRIDISQDFFGDQLTASMGYSQADDEVRNNLDDSFLETVDRRHYRVGLSFIFARWGYLTVNYEGISDEGFLNNPYRSVRYDDGSSSSESYPGTRNSDAFSAKVAFSLPWQAALKFRSSYFSDSWAINAFSLEGEYSQKIRDNVLFDIRLRSYHQGSASFYSDIFSTTEIRQFEARDKELSEYSNLSIGFGGTYKIKLNGFFEDFSSSLQYDHMFFKYDNFREATDENIAIYGLGNEPFYEFDAYALRVFFTLSF